MGCSPASFDLGTVGEPGFLNAQSAGTGSADRATAANATSVNSENNRDVWECIAAPEFDAEIAEFSLPDTN